MDNSRTAGIRGRGNRSGDSGFVSAPAPAPRLGPVRGAVRSVPLRRAAGTVPGRYGAGAGRVRLLRRVPGRARGCVRGRGRAAVRSRARAHLRRGQHMPR
jgi:hypothetical protein